MFWSFEAEVCHQESLQLAKNVKNRNQCLDDHTSMVGDQKTRIDWGALALKLLAKLIINLSKGF